MSPLSKCEALLITDSTPMLLSRATNGSTAAFRPAFLLVLLLALSAWASPLRAEPQLSSPLPGEPLAGASETFTWESDDASIDQWWLWLGSAAGQPDLHDSGLIVGERSHAVEGLPRDGRTVHARLWFRASGSAWQFVDSTHQADANALPALEAPGSTLPGTRADIGWSGGEGIGAWWLYVGTSPGASDIVDSRQLDAGTRSYRVSGLPSDGSTVHARLWFRNAAAGSPWLYTDATFTATTRTDTPPAIATPAEGSTLEREPTLSWSPEESDVDDWWVYAGDSLGGRGYLDSGSLGGAARELVLTGLPDDGSTVFVRLWYLPAGGGWRYLDRTFTARTAPSTTSAPFPHLDDYELAFSDEFDGTSLDSSKWYTGFLWGPYYAINNEDQLYVDTLGMHSAERGTARDPFDVSGGTLKITATPTSAELSPPPRPPRDSGEWKRRFSTYRYGDPVGSPGESGYRPGYDPDDVDYLSGIITSYESFKATHGYFEMRAKLPAGRGLWPAFWMLPTHYVESVPEIDIMEFLGQDVDRLYHTYHHFDVANDWQLISTPSYRSNAEDWTTDFHTFGAVWSPREISFYVDGVKARTVRNSEFRTANQAMYLLANLAVGGNWPGPADESTPFPATFEIDYIRAYKKKLSASLNLSRDYQMMFNDEFDGERLDPEKWETHFIWGPYLPINREDQYYVDALESDSDVGYSPFTLADGKLTITARAAEDPDGVAPPAMLPELNDPIWADNPTFRRNESYAPQDFTSGIITSYESFRFVQGYAEIRAKLPKGKGLWPAFWLLNRYYVGQSPEIDILETRGERPREITHAYHRRVSGGALSSNVFETVGGDETDGYSDDFHTFGVRWRPGSITWYIDREPVKTYTGDDVSYQLMYVIANLAVGGGFPASPDDPSVFPARYEIDYIRVYQEKDPG